jgi:hypothetical protein
MNASFPSRVWVIGLGAVLGIAGAFVLLPRARGTAAAQAALALGYRPEWMRAVYGGTAPRLARVLAEAPEDAELHEGAAFLEQSNIEIPGSDQDLPGFRERKKSAALLARLEDVARRFPTDARVRAHLLRHLLREPGLIRFEEPLGIGVPPPPRYADPTLEPRRREALRRFQSAATDGRPLEPDNGYFDTMLAVAAFSAGNDDEALRHLHAAAAKTRWDDHVAAEAYAQWKLLTAAYGSRGALQSSPMVWGMLFPHFAPVRWAAKRAVAQAGEREHAGDHAAGIAIRGDVMRLGLHIRGGHPTLIGKLVGAALFDIGASPWPPEPRLSRPQEPAQPPAPRFSRERAQERRERYVRYLAAHGAADEAAWVREEGDRLDARFASLRQSETPTQGASAAARLLVGWTLGLALWRQIAALLVLWGAAVLIGRSRRGRWGLSGRTPRTVWLLTGLGVFIGPFLLVAPLLRLPVLEGGLILGGVLAGLLALAVRAGQRGEWISREAGDGPADGSTLWRPALAALVSVLPTVGGLALAGVLISQGGKPVLEEGIWSELVTRFLLAGQFDWWLGGALLAFGLIPAGLISFLVLCRVAALDQPLLPGLARGVRRVVPFALVLLVALYVAVLAPTVAADRTAEYQVRELLTDEEGYLDGTG